MKVLLVWPLARGQVAHAEALGWGTLGALAEPLALEYLASAVAMEGHEAHVLDLRLQPDGLEEALRVLEPDVVGVTAYSLHVLAALEVLAAVKQRDPTCHTVVGGHHASLLPEDFFEPQVDSVVVGEGTGPLRGLLRSLAAGSSRVPVPGVWARGEGGFESGGPPEPFDVDELPLPDRSTTSHARDRYFIDEMSPVALLRTSVGCPYRCSFCSLWRVMEGRYHKRSCASVVQELAGIQEEWVFLVDDEAFIDGPRMKVLADAIAAAGLRKKFFAYCRIDTLIREVDAIRAWRALGLRRLFIGIEAITQERQLEFNKRLELAAIEQGLALAKELDIDVMGQFIVPTDASARDFKRIARFVEHHQIRFPSFTILTPIPGTEYLTDFESVTELQANGRPNWDLFDCQHVVTRTALPREEFMAGYRDLQRLFTGNYANYWKTDGGALTTSGRAF